MNSATTPRGYGMPREKARHGGHGGGRRARRNAGSLGEAIGRFAPRTAVRSLILGGAHGRPSKAAPRPRPGSEGRVIGWVVPPPCSPASSVISVSFPVLAVAPWRRGAESNFRQ